jgi:hypothetical protein
MAHKGCLWCADYYTKVTTNKHVQRIRRVCQAGQDRTCEKWWKEEGGKRPDQTRDLPCFRPRPKGVI